MIELSCASCGRNFLRKIRNTPRGKRGRSVSRVYCSQTCVSHSQRKPSSNETALRELVRGCLKTAKRRPKLLGMVHDLTITQGVELYVMQGGLCAVTRVPIHVFTENPLLRPSLDRIDSSGPYTVTNVRWVCRGYNMLKLNHNDSTAVDALTVMSCGVTHGHGR